MFMLFLSTFVVREVFIVSRKEISLYWEMAKHWRKKY